MTSYITGNRWLDESDRAQAGGNPFTVVRDGPPTMTARQVKSQKLKDTEWECAHRELLLRAHPPLYPEESEDARLRRAGASDCLWQTIEARINSSLERTDALVFEQLLHLAQATDVEAILVEQDGSRYGLHAIPTALVLAGGVNSADHVRTFPNLACHLRSSGCSVALLQSSHFPSTSIAVALNSALCQLTGLAASNADTFDALASWYKDHREGQALQPSANGVVANTSDTIAPVVIIIDSIESVPQRCLEDLIRTLSEGWTALPITLVLGATTSAAALTAALPSDLIDKALDCRRFNLATAMARLETLVEEVLLGSWPGLIISYELTKALWEAFLVHYFSPGVIVRGWRIAALAHCAAQPAVSLASASLDGVAALRDACGTLNQLDLNFLTPQDLSGAKGNGIALGEALLGVIDGWRKWALAIRFIVTTARAVGLTNGYTYWQVYRDALDPDFVSSGSGKELLLRLDAALKKLSTDAMSELLGNIQAQIQEVIKEDCVGAWASECKRAVELLLNDDDAAHAGGLAAPSAEEDTSKAVHRDDRDGDGAAPVNQKDHHQVGEPAPKKRRDRYYSKASRQTALMVKSRSQSRTHNGKARPDSENEDAGPSAAASISSRAAQWLTTWLLQALKHPPPSLSGASIFTCSDVSSLDALTAAPRHALHTALTQPHLFCSARDDDATASGADSRLGITADVEDACLAYQLYDQDPACVNVADWFTAFREVRLAGNASAQQGLQNQSYAGASDDHAEAVAKRGRGKTLGRKQELSKKGGKEKSTLGIGKQPNRDQEMAARFSQAAAELQFVGFLKPRMKRRRGETVSRSVHMPAVLLGAT